ncbi:alkaline phosphatase [Photobacterium sagamiensis]|uniref:alkaline phosphatase n=1 Tax=Photobacterium sagamiensis TaxID=2910241 RepID=UPI003D0A42BC
MKRTTLLSMMIPPAFLLTACGAIAAPQQIVLPQQNDAAYVQAKALLAQANKYKINNNKAKNVIIFIGDGMGVSTITPARILAGQRQGLGGEEYRLAFEQLPHVALSKTYNADMQVSDSASTATAIMSGTRTNFFTLGHNDKVKKGDCSTSAGNKVMNIMELAESKGLATGVVTNTRVTHATPANGYAHSVDRGWEVDAKMPAKAIAEGCKDIASQLIDFNYGDGLDVAMGGGRAYFMPKGQQDPVYKNKSGIRQDGRNLIQEWTEQGGQAAYVYDRQGLAGLDTKNTSKLLGLFQPSHMKFNADVKPEDSQPTLSEMTSTAIDVLSNRDQGYMLMIEGGLIDKGHHAGNAARALDETIEFDKAIQMALGKVDLEETLIIVTADHSHSFTMNGYSERGNPILGLVQIGGKPMLDLQDGKPFTSLGYLNGPGAIKGERKHLTQEEATDINFKQQAAISGAKIFGGETHSGEDVAIFAQGPKSHLFQGTVEQNYIFHVMNEALGLTQ